MQYRELSTCYPLSLWCHSSLNVASKRWREKARKKSSFINVNRISFSPSFCFNLLHFRVILKSKNFLLFVSDLCLLIESVVSMLLFPLILRIINFLHEHHLCIYQSISITKQNGNSNRRLDDDLISSTSSFSCWLSSPFFLLFSLSFILFFSRSSRHLFSSLGSLRRNNDVCSSRMIVSKWDMLHHGERINQEMTLSADRLKLRPQLRRRFCPPSTSHFNTRQKQFILNFKPIFINNVQSSTSSSSSSLQFARSIPIVIEQTSIASYFLSSSYLFAFISFSFLVMQQLSNDTSSWNLIDIPLSVPLFSNSNTYENLVNVGQRLNDWNDNSILPISIDPSSSSISEAIIHDAHSTNYWAFALIFFPLFTIFGNVLVVVSVYREKSLHTVTNYFVVSLAISDITVAAVVMPFAIYLEVSEGNRCWLRRLTWNVIDRQKRNQFYLSNQTNFPSHS